MTITQQIGKAIHLLYSVDTHHTFKSRYLHGVFLDDFEAIEAIRELISNNRDFPKLSNQDERNLELFGQTQGYKGDGEFEIVKMNVNEIDCYL